MALFSRGGRDRDRSTEKTTGPTTRGLRADPHLLADLPLIERAVAGDQRPLTTRLAELRGADRWLHRDALLQRAVPRTGESASWVHDWFLDAPEDPDAAALRAQVLALGEESALHGATDALDETARRTPSDPAAWAPLFDHCRRLRLGIGRLHDLVSRATEGAPHGFGWRLGAVDCLSPFWFGSLEESWDFAVTSAEVDPGSRLVLLPALAATRALGHERTETGEAMIRQSLPPALDYVRDADDEVEQVETANLMAARLHAAGLARQARIFAEVAADRVATAPWLREGVDDPLAAFALAARA